MLEIKFIYMAVKIESNSHLIPPHLISSHCNMKSTPQPLELLPLASTDDDEPDTRQGAQDEADPAVDGHAKTGQEKEEKGGTGNESESMGQWRGGGDGEEEGGQKDEGAQKTRGDDEEPEEGQIEEIAVPADMAHLAGEEDDGE